LEKLLQLRVSQYFYVILKYVTKIFKQIPKVVHSVIRLIA
jgi:hypothetical protein